MSSRQAVSPSRSRPVKAASRFRGARRDAIPMFPQE